MIQIPTVVVVLAWVLLVGLAGLLAILYRQLGYLMGLGIAVTDKGGLQIGDPAPVFEYDPMDDASLSPGRRTFDPAEGGETLILIADPGCSPCVKTLEVLRQAITKGFTKGLAVLVISEAPLKRLRNAEVLAAFPTVVGSVDSDVISAAFRTHQMPYVYAVGSDGLVRGRGVPADERSIRALVRELRNSSHGNGNERFIEEGANRHASRTPT